MAIFAHVQINDSAERRHRMPSVSPAPSDMAVDATRGGSRAASARAATGGRVTARVRALSSSCLSAHSRRAPQASTAGPRTPKRRPGMPSRAPSSRSDSRGLNGRREGARVFPYTHRRLGGWWNFARVAHKVARPPPVLFLHCRRKTDGELGRVKTHYAEFGSGRRLQ